MFCRNVLSKKVNGKILFYRGFYMSINEPYVKIWEKDSIEIDDDIYFVDKLIRMGFVKEGHHPKKIITKDNISKLYIQITENCNMRCSHCYAKSIESKKEINLTSIKKLIDDAIDQGMLYIIYSGGEPLLHKDISQILQYGYEKGLYQIIFTNGSEVQKNYNIIKKYVHEVQLSLDGDEEFHDNFRNYKGAYRKVIKALQIIDEKKVKKTVAMSVFDSNVHLIDHVKKLSSKYNANFRFSPPAPVGHYENTADEKYIYLMNKIEKYLGSNCKGFSELNPKNGVKNRCDALRKKLYITADLNIYPCPLLSSSNFIIDKYDNKGLDKFFKSVNYLSAIDNVNKVWFNECADCDLNCLFWCPAFFLKSLSEKTKSPFCKNL